jgi:tetratricopeptide (TPR) repeat protein
MATFSASTNDYKNALWYAQKAIDFAKSNRDMIAEAEASLALGILYLELDKPNDATQSLNRSVEIYNTLPVRSETAYAHYNLGLSEVKKENYVQAELHFEKAQSIYEELRIPGAIDLLTLQKAIVYNANDKTEDAVALFNNLISRPNTNENSKVRAEALYYMGAIDRWLAYRHYMLCTLRNDGRGNKPGI